MSDDVEIAVNKFAFAVQVSRELLDDGLPPFEELVRRAEAKARAFRALPAEEQERVLAERKAAYEAERCTACGCHPDEHGDG